MESGWKEGYKTQPMAQTVGYEAVKGSREKRDGVFDEEKQVRCKRTERCAP